MTILQKTETKKQMINMDKIILLNLFVGLFGFPMWIRVPLMSDYIGMLAYCNFFVMIAVILAMVKNRTYCLMELFPVICWLILCGLMFWSNYQQVGVDMNIRALINLGLPGFLLFYRIDIDKQDRYMHIFMIAFTVFVAAMFVLGIEEKLTGNWCLKQLYQWKAIDEYKSYLGVDGIGEWRFGSAWGHPLTMALIFNGFYIVNDIYHLCTEKNIHVFFPLQFLLEEYF